MVKGLLGVAFPLMIFEVKIDIGVCDSHIKAQRDQGCESHGAIIYRRKLGSLPVEKTLARYPRSRRGKWTETANIVDFPLAK